LAAPAPNDIAAPIAAQIRNFIFMRPTS